MSSGDEQLQFSGLLDQIADSLNAAAVLFDADLRILESTAGLRRLLPLDRTIDAALSAITEGTLGQSWKDLLESSLRLNQKAVFTKIPCTSIQPRLLDIICVPIHDGGGQVIGGAVLLYDVSDKDVSYQPAPSAAVGQLAGKMAHELNSPLDGILRYVNLSLRMLEQGQPEKASIYMQHCRAGLQRMAQIITEMLEFSRSSYFASESSPIDKLLDEALRSLDGTLRSVEVRVLRADAGPLPQFRSSAMFQVFSNIIKNAADAMAGQGTLTITLGRNETGWRIDFADTGPGFAPHAPEDLFRPFFTTKAPGRGTGLGLSICRDILEKFGGRISAANLAEGGACFSVHLPAGLPVRS